MVFNECYVMSFSDARIWANLFNNQKTQKLGLQSLFCNKSFHFFQLNVI